MSKNKKNWISQKKSDLIDQIDFEEFSWKLCFKFDDQKSSELSIVMKHVEKKNFHFIQKNFQC